MRSTEQINPRHAFKGTSDPYSIKQRKARRSVFRQSVLAKSPRQRGGTLIAERARDIYAAHLSYPIILSPTGDATPAHASGLL